ncbi:MAG: DUF975 family protein [Bacteroidales bacterium]|nr:DUF975 family protein [Bacteroidales bacterium]
MKSISQNKREARESLRGNWAPCVLAMALYIVVTMVCMSPSYMYQLLHPTFSQDLAYAAQTNNITDMIGIYGGMSRMSSIGSLLQILILNAVTVGFMGAFLKFYREKDTAVAGNMFNMAFKDYGHKILGMFLMGLFIFLWTLLLIIPGIIKSFSYAMTPYILNEYPNVGVNDSIDISRKMMKGHKLDLFLLELSFIGWILLSILTLGIGLLWLGPYMQTSMSIFYEDVKAEYIEKNGDMAFR